MIKANDNFRELPDTYLFTEISRRIAKYKEQHPDKSLIRMDIGDIPGPLAACVTEAMRKAVTDMSVSNGFRGYGPEQGYSFLRDKIAEIDYHSRGIDIDSSEIFIGDGAKCDLGNFGDILSRDCKIAVMNPSYPAYTDDNVIDGRAGKYTGKDYSGITYLECSSENGFCPDLPDVEVDIIYICSPNNPTGTVLPKEELKKWVDYAKEHKSLIIFDSAYESYIRTSGMPKSIYEIEGSKEVAVEIRSFSKSGGFTGVRCGYTVVPKSLKGYYSNGQPVSLNLLWNRRQTTKFNGASYISQRGAEALYSLEGQESIRKMTDSFLKNVGKLRGVFEKTDWKVFGGNDSPYLWVGNPYGLSSYELFDKILTECGISVTPGSGFGLKGEGYIRLSGFNTLSNTDIAVARFSEWLNLS